MNTKKDEQQSKKDKQPPKKDEQPSKISDILKSETDVVLIGENDSILELTDFYSPRLMQCRRCPLDKNQCSMRVEEDEIESHERGDECGVERGIVITTAQWLLTQGVTSADIILVSNLIKAIVDGDRISRMGSRIAFSRFNGKDDMNTISKYITMSTQTDTRIQKALKELMATRKEKYLAKSMKNSIAYNMKQKLGDKQNLNQYIESEDDDTVIKDE